MERFLIYNGCRVHDEDTCFSLIKSSFVGGMFKEMFGIVTTQFTIFRIKRQPRIAQTSNNERPLTELNPLQSFLPANLRGLKDGDNKYYSPSIHQWDICSP